MAIEVIRRSYVEDHLSPESGQGHPCFLFIPFH
jgi:hypothetical protein